MIVLHGPVQRQSSKQTKQERDKACFYGDWDNHLAMSEAEEHSFMAPQKGPSFRAPLLGSQGKLPTTAKSSKLGA